MSYEYCQSWDEEKKECKAKKDRCRYSHLDENGKCDGWYYYEYEIKTEEEDYEYEEE